MAGGMEVAIPLAIPSATGVGGHAVPSILVLAGKYLPLAAAAAAADGGAEWSPLPATAAPGGQSASAPGAIDLDTIVDRMLREPLQGASTARIDNGSAVTCVGRARWTTTGRLSFPSYLVVVATATEASLMALRDSDRQADEVPPHIKHLLGKLKVRFARAARDSGGLVYTAVNATAGATGDWAFAHRVLHTVADTLPPILLKASSHATRSTSRGELSRGFTPTSPGSAGATGLSGALGTPTGARAVDEPDGVSPSQPLLRRRFGPPRLAMSLAPVSAGALMLAPEPCLAPVTDGLGAVCARCNEAPASPTVRPRQLGSASAGPTAAAVDEPRARPSKIARLAAAPARRDSGVPSFIGSA
jgi:hypothetical protein